MTAFLFEQVQATRDLIALEPTEIALVRPGTQTRTPAGGMAPAGPPQNLEAKNRFFSATAAQDRLSIEVGGKLVNVDYVLVGLPGDDIKADDTFTVDGKDFRILYVCEENAEYETRAYVVRG